MIFKKDGTGLIKVIAPGQGATGFYPADVLERDGPKVFTKGTQMFLDHQTSMEERHRPEGSVKDLAAVFTENAYWDANGKDGAGLYAPIKAFTAYRPVLEEIGPHIGVSIRAHGKIGKGLVEGKEHPKVVESLTHAKSVDMVTRAGAGGRFVEMLESARAEAKVHPQAEELAEITEAATRRTQEDPMADTSITAEVEKTLRESEAREAKLRAEIALRDARDIIKERLKVERLPDVAKERILKEALVAIPTKEAGELDREALLTQVREAITDQMEYIHRLGGGSPVRNMGSAAATKTGLSNEDWNKRMTESLVAQGLSPEAAAASLKEAY